MLSIGEVAEQLQVSPSLVRKWANTGVIKAVRLPQSKHRRFPASEVERILREMREQD
jgi:excisionase family DNA binding protein